MRKFCALPSKPPKSMATSLSARSPLCPYGRMADVVGETGEVDEVGVAAQPDRHAPPDLGHLERVGQPGPWRLALPRTDDLGLVGQPAQGGTVQHPGAVAGEVGAVFGVGARQCGTLGRLGHQALAVEVVVWVVAARIHRRTVCQDCSPVSGARGAMPVRLTVMRNRVARLLSLVLAVLTAGLVLVPTAPTAWADPPFRLADYVTDDANALSGGQRAEVQTAVDDLYNARRIRLWVVYVDSFSGQAAADVGPKHDADQRLPGRGRHSRRRHRRPRLRVSGSGAAARGVDVDTPAPQRGRARVAQRRLGRRRRGRRGWPEPGALVRTPGSAGWAWWPSWRSSPSRCWRCCCGGAAGGASAARPSSPPRNGWIRRTPTRLRRSPSTRSTTCPGRSSSTSTTRCAPATTNWHWRSRNSGRRTPHRSPLP